MTKCEGPKLPHVEIEKTFKSGNSMENLKRKLKK